MSTSNNAAQRRYRELHLEVVKERQQKWREKNREYIKKQNKFYYARSKEKHIIFWWAIPGVNKSSAPVVALQIEQVAEIVSEYYKIPVPIIRHKTKKREVVQARQIIMTLMRKHTPNSLQSIADYFEGKKNGNRKDHTTVIHAVKVIGDLMDSDPTIQKQFTILDSKICQLYPQSGAKSHSFLKKDSA